MNDMDGNLTAVAVDNRNWLDIALNQSTAPATTWHVATAMAIILAVRGNGNGSGDQSEQLAGAYSLLREATPGLPSADLSSCVEYLIELHDVKGLAAIAGTVKKSNLNPELKNRYYQFIDGNVDDLTQREATEVLNAVVFDVDRRIAAGAVNYVAVISKSNEAIDSLNVEDLTVLARCNNRMGSSDKRAEDQFAKYFAANYRNLDNFADKFSLYTFLHHHISGSERRQIALYAKRVYEQGKAILPEGDRETVLFSLAKYAIRLREIDKFVKGVILSEIESSKIPLSLGLFKFLGQNKPDNEFFDDLVKKLEIPHIAKDPNIYPYLLFFLGNQRTEHEGLSALCARRFKNHFNEYDDHNLAKGLHGIAMLDLEQCGGFLYGRRNRLAQLQDPKSINKILFLESLCDCNHSGLALQNIDDNIDRDSRGTGNRREERLREVLRDILDTGEFKGFQLQTSVKLDFFEVDCILVNAETGGKIVIESDGVMHFKGKNRLNGRDNLQDKWLIKNKYDAIHVNGKLLDTTGQFEVSLLKKSLTHVLSGLIENQANGDSQSIIINAI